jgi:Complex I intermediate-associated protein 30 (CIA30)
MLRTEPRGDRVAYCRSFDEVVKGWITVHISFQVLIAILRVKTVKDRSFDLSYLNALRLRPSKFEYDGALNPNFQPGAFQLQIE